VFEQTFHRKAQFVARAPGRVNLIGTLSKGRPWPLTRDIGEHIDYCGYSVLPMAVEKDIIVAVAADDDDVAEGGDLKLHCANTNTKYPMRVFEHGMQEGWANEKKHFTVDKTGKFTIDPTKHDWTSYFLAGYKKYFEETPEAKPKTLFLLFDGTVPAGSGLSSSSAMVCVSILATQHATGGSHSLVDK